MRAGELRHEVAIQAATETRDAVGQVVQTWSTAATVRAAIWPLRGDELYRARQIHPEADSRIRIRYYSGLTTAYRLLYGSRTMNILHVANWDERGVYQDLLVREVS